MPLSLAKAPLSCQYKGLYEFGPWDYSGRLDLLAAADFQSRRLARKELRVVQRSLERSGLRGEQLPHLLVGVWRESSGGDGPWVKDTRRSRSCWLCGEVAGEVGNWDCRARRRSRIRPCRRGRGGRGRRSGSLVRGADKI